MSDFVVDAEIIRTQENTPCGQACVPLGASCIIGAEGAVALIKDLQITTKPEVVRSVAQLACGYEQTQQEIVAEATNAIDSLESTLRQEAIDKTFWESIAISMSTDALTGLHTGTAFEMALQNMYDNGTMDELAKNGYVLDLVILDVNNLKKHNDMSHAHGDLALKAVADTLSELYRRKSDMRVLLHPKRTELEVVDTTDADIARSNEAGDEMLLLSFHHPSKGFNRSATGLEMYSKLHAGLSEGIFYTIEHDGEEKKYEVTVTFAQTRAEIPETYDAFNMLRNEIDRVVMQTKKRTNKTVSEGVFLPRNNYTG